MRAHITALGASTGKPVLYGGDMNVAHLVRICGVWMGIHMLCGVLMRRASRHASLPPQDADIYNADAKHIPKSAGTSPGERAAFGEMLRECALVDTFRAKHPDATHCYTYWSQRAGNRRARIQRCGTVARCAMRLLCVLLLLTRGSRMRAPSPRQAVQPRAAAGLLGGVRGDGVRGRRRTEAARRLHLRQRHRGRERPRACGRGAGTVMSRGAPCAGGAAWTRVLGGRCHVPGIRASSGARPSARLRSARTARAHFQPPRSRGLLAPPARPRLLSSRRSSTPGRTHGRLLCRHVRV